MVDATMQVQGVMNFIFYIILGMIGLFLVVYILYVIYQRLTYKYHVFLYKKVGDTEIIFEDQARQVKLEGNYMFRYRKLKKYSPVIDMKYFRIVQKPILGMFPNSMLSFNAYLLGESIFPIAVKNNPGMTPINLDLFNYMQARLKVNQAKYTKQNMLVQMLPYVAIGAVILMFIVGMIFYTKHIERISMQIINAAQTTADTIMTKTGGAQIVKPA